MKHLALLIGLYVAAVLETDPAGWSAETGVVFCPLYLLGCLAAWYNEPLRAAVWGAAIGLVTDALTSGPPGIETVCVATLAWSAARMRCHYQWQSLTAFCLCSATVIAGLSLGSGLLRTALIDGGIGRSSLLLSSLGSGFASALCGLLLLIPGRALQSVTPVFATKSR